MTPRWLPPLLLVPVLAAAGAVTGVATLALHSRWWGVPLVALTLLAVLRALPRRWWTRLPFALGWEVPVLLVGLWRGPGGDVVVAADAPGYALLVLALVVAVGVVVTLPARRSSPAQAGPVADESSRPPSSA